MGPVRVEQRLEGVRGKAGPDSPLGSSPKQGWCLSDIVAWPSGDGAGTGHLSRMGETPFLFLFPFGANLSLLCYNCRYWCLVGPPLYEEGIKSHRAMARLVEQLFNIREALGSISNAT